VPWSTTPSELIATTRSEVAQRRRRVFAVHLVADTCGATVLCDQGPDRIGRPGMAGPILDLEQRELGKLPRPAPDRLILRFGGHGQRPWLSVDDRRRPLRRARRGHGGEDQPRSSVAATLTSSTGGFGSSSMTTCPVGKRPEGAPTARGMTSSLRSQRSRGLDPLDRRHSIVSCWWKGLSSWLWLAPRSWQKDRRDLAIRH
jgi:hypothetical protein